MLYTDSKNLEEVMKRLKEHPITCRCGGKWSP